MSKSSISRSNLRASASRIAFVGLAMVIGSGTYLSSANAQALLLDPVGSPATQGSGQGGKAVWSNAGTVNGVAVDLYAEFTQATLAHTFSTGSNAPLVSSVGQDDVKMEWRIYQAGTYTFGNPAGGVLVPADVHIQINDVDGPNNEEVHVPVCNGVVNWVRIDRSATTDRSFGVVAGIAETFSLIGDSNYNNQPESGLEILWAGVDTFEFGRTANNGFVIRISPPSYSAFDTLDFECGDFAIPTANADAESGTSGDPITFDILTNDALATSNDNGPNNNHQTASEYGRTSVSLITPAGATNVQTDAEGHVIGFDVPNEGTWAYDDATGGLTFTPLANFTLNPAPIDYEYTNALDTTSNQATVTYTYPTPNDGVVTIEPNSNPGDTLPITVTDADLIGAGTITVQVVNATTGETETITLTESAATPGLFEGSVDTAYGTGSGGAGDGSLNTQPGDTVTVTYVDALSTTGFDVDRTADDSVTGGVDGVVDITDTLAPGEPALISVNDADLIGTGTLDVVVINPATGESEIVTLTESATTPGLFEASLPTVYGNTPGTDDDGTMSVQDGHTLQVTYDDAFTASGGTASPTDTGTIAGGTDATLVSSDEIAPGEFIYVAVTDADQNTDPNVIERFTVQVVNNRTGEIETLELIETGADTGIFECDLPSNFGTTAGPNDDGTMTVQVGDVITVTYDDLLTSTGTPDQLITDTDVTNLPPIAADDSAGTQPGVPVSLPVLTNDSDPENQPLTIESVTQPANGSVTFMPDGTVIYTPNPGFTGTDTFTYTINDGNGGTDTATVTINVSDTSPTAVADSGATTPDTPVTIPVLGNDTDPNSDPLTVTNVVQPPNGTVVANPDGTVTYTPNPGFTGTDTFSYDACDADGNCDTAIVSVNVNADSPQGVDDTATTLVDTPVTLAPLDNDTDPNGDPLTVTDITDAGNGTAVLNPDGTVSYTPNPGFVGTDTITYTVCDDNGNCDTAAITVTVTNQPPVAEDDSAGTQPGVPVSLPIIANDSDPDGHPLTVTDVTQPANGTVTFTPDGTVIYTPNPGFTGVDTFTYTISDGFGGTDTATVTINVDDDTPTAVADSGATTPDTPVTIPVLGNDSDPNGDPLTVANVTQPGDGTVVVNPDGTVTYTPNPGFTGTDTFTYEACDSDGNCDTAIVSVTVSADSPQGVDDVETTPSDTPVTIAPLGNDTDPNGDPLTVTDITDPGNGTAVLNPDGTVTYTPNPGFVGTDTITYTVCDDDGNCDTAAITVTVTNQPPVAEDDSTGTQPGEAVSVPVIANDTDPEGGPLTLTDVTQPANGTVTFTPEGTVIYTPNPGYTGVDTFDYTICDEFGACDTATVTINVDNDTPTAVADSGATTPDTPVIIPVLGNDTDPNDDPLTVTEVTQPGNGTAAINPDGTVTYTPNPGFVGTDTFTYTACDADGNCDTATVTVNVDPSAPQGVDDVYDATPGQPLTVAPLGNDIDPDGDPLTITDITDPGNGTIVINPDGTVTYTPNGGFNGVDTVTYTVCDDSGNCDTATITFDVRTTATISGVVFQDTDGDDVYDIGEPLLGGVIVEIVAPDGTVVATTTSGVDGSYVVADLPPGTYRVVFRDPETGTAVGVIDVVDASPGENIVDQNLPIDPAGVVYDSLTGAPVSGVTVVMTDVNGTPLPATCFVDASQQPQVTGSDGAYRFDIVPGADSLCPASETQYNLEVTLPGGVPAIFGFDPEASPLDATTCTIDAIPGGTCQVFGDIAPPAAGTASIFFTTFLLAPGDPNVVNNHIPVNLAAAAQPLTASKRASSATASTGSVIVYTITVTNDQTVDLNDTDVIDTLPVGFQYVEGTSRVEGVEIEPVNTNGQLLWSDVDVPAGGSIVISLGTVVGAGVVVGDYTNTAFVETGPGNLVLSNIAEAQVRIKPDEIFDCSEVLGKVFEDENLNGVQDEGEDGLPGVRVATARGQLITTDEYGRYSIPCAATPKPGIGSNFIVKVDERTLPTGFQISTENPRVVRLTQGKMSQANFGATMVRVVRMDMTDAAFLTGTVALSPDQFSRIDEVVARLKEQESVLKLSYVGNSGGSERLKQVADLVRKRWGDGPYDLVIETQSLSANMPEGK